MFVCVCHDVAKFCSGMGEEVANLSGLLFEIMQLLPENCLS